MSADNRIIIDFYDNKWQVWHGSLSHDYYKPIDGAKCFDNAKDAMAYAEEEAKTCAILEGGIQTLTDSERINALREEVKYLEDELKHPTYCPTCGACGEEGCCSASKCNHGFCLYGESYAKDHEYYRLMTNRLFDLATTLDKDALDKIFKECHNKIYNTKYENT
jgi:hypothetical protein